jgi:hypothetical protein
VERVVARRLEIVGELLDPRFVRDGRKWVWRAGVRLGGVLAVLAVDLVQLLGLRVIGLELVVGDRPGRRDPIVVLEVLEILRPQPIERRAVELRGAADEVVDLRLERLPFGVVPGVLGDVAVVDEDVLGEPVGGFAREPVAPLEQQDSLPGGCQVPREGAAACPGADDDDVVRVDL